MKFFRLYAVAAILATSLLMCSCENEGGLTSIRGRLDELEQVVIPSINQQLASISASVESLDKTNSLLADYIKTIREDIADLGNGITPDMKGIQNQIDDLSDKCSQFSDDLDNLKKYINDKDSATRDWTSATFATLEQYNTLQSDLSKIKALIDDIDTDALKSELLSALKGEIASSIKASEDSMKDWIGEKLEGYYTIAEINAKLAELSVSGSGSLSEEDKTLINGLRDEIKKAKDDLTKAYEDAIAKAINDNSGVIDEKIAAAISAANLSADDAIKSINEAIEGLEERIKTLEQQVKTILERVQSITVVPEYTDGSVGISATENRVIRFEIYPAEAAKAIAALGKDAISLRAVYTKTKADAGEFVDLNILYSVYTNGVFRVSASGANLDEDFYDGTFGASARLLVTAAGTSISSQYFPLCPAE